MVSPTEDMSDLLPDGISIDGRDKWNSFEDRVIYGVCVFRVWGGVATRVHPSEWLTWDELPKDCLSITKDGENA